MFVKPRQFAFGAVFLTPAVGVTAIAPASAAPTDPPKTFCIVNALSQDQQVAGLQSTTVCFATKAEVQAVLSGPRVGPALDAIPGAYVLAYYYNDAYNPANATSYTAVTGDSCNDAVYLMPPSWQANTLGWGPGICSKAKHFTGANFTGSWVLTSGSFFGFNGAYAGFAGQVRSAKFAV